MVRTCSAVFEVVQAPLIQGLDCGSSHSSQRLQFSARAASALCQSGNRRQRRQTTYYPAQVRCHLLLLSVFTTPGAWVIDHLFFWLPPESNVFLGKEAKENLAASPQDGPEYGKDVVSAGLPGRWPWAYFIRQLQDADHVARSPVALWGLAVCRQNTLRVVECRPGSASHLSSSSRFCVSWARGPLPRAPPPVCKVWSCAGPALIASVGKDVWEAWVQGVPLHSWALLPFLTGLSARVPSTWSLAHRVFSIHSLKASTRGVSHGGPCWVLGRREWWGGALTSPGFSEPWVQAAHEPPQNLFKCHCLAPSPDLQNPAFRVGAGVWVFSSRLGDFCIC